MDDPLLEQRLSAILAADAAGYSRLMTTDESATVAALEDARSVFRKRVALHRGRVIDMAGDSVLAEFGTAKGALAAAVECQKEIAARCEGIPAERMMLFRIGVHLGDVIVKPDGSVYGDGVNIAARLQALASPGGVTVSEAVRSALRGKVEARFTDRGEQTVKNIPEPLRVYDLQDETPSPPPPPGVTGAADAMLALPDKPSIAVLPFTNMSGDAEQEFFCDGITEDIITELSRFRSLFVIARNSTFTYKGKAVDVRTVARELGVRYVLEGSIRRAGERVRATAQLIDATTGTHIWAEKFDRVLDDIFGVQEEVTRGICAAIAPEIETREDRRLPNRPSSFSAYETAVRAWAMVRSDPGHAESPIRAAAVELARQALAIDPESALATRTIGFSTAVDLYYGASSLTPQAREEAMRLMTRAVAADPGSHDARLDKGLVLCFCGRTAEGLLDMRAARELNPNDARTAAWLGFFEALCGDPPIGLRLSTEALRLSPRDPQRYLALNMLGWVYFAAGDYPHAADAARQALSAVPNFPASQLCLTLALAGVGDVANAHVEFLHARELAPQLVEDRLAGKWLGHWADYHERATRLLHVAARG